MHNILIKKFEQNFFEKFNYVPSLSSNFTLIINNEYNLSSLNQNTLYYNNVYNCNFSNNFDHKFNNICNFFKERNHDFSWWINPSSEPQSIQNKLKEHNFNYVFTYPGMILNYHNLKINNINEKLLIKLVESEADRQILIDLHMKRGDHFAPLKDYGHIIFQESSKYKNFIGYYDNIPVALGSVFFSKYFSILCDIFTLEQYRNRAFAKTMTKKCLDYAYHNGFENNIILSTNAGIPLYKQIGYQQICEFIAYKYNN